jgi:hypothetical protein
MQLVTVRKFNTGILVSFGEKQSTAITTHSTSHQGSWKEEAKPVASRVWQQVVNTASGIDFSLANSHE